jgi:hypothetical protein
LREKLKELKVDLFIEREEEVFEEAPKVDGVEIIDVVDGVKLIGICELIDKLYPDYWGNTQYTYEETSKAIMDWCEKYDAHYYADVHEEFSVYVGVREAKENNKSVVVVEDLS